MLGLHTLPCNCPLGKWEQTPSVRSTKCPKRVLNSSKVTLMAELGLDSQCPGFPTSAHILISWYYHHYTKGLVVSFESWVLPLKYTIFPLFF